MKIEFELNERQSAVLKEIAELPQNKGKTENDLCKTVVIQALIGAKQQIVANELSR